MKKFDLELAVGLFFIFGICCLTYLSIKLGRMEVIGGRGTLIYAAFSNVGGLKKGAPVEIAGVEIGRVKDIVLYDYRAKVGLLVNPDIQIQEDAIGTVKTKGLVGEKFVEITPGASDKVIASQGMIRETQPAFDMGNAISRFIFRSPQQKDLE